LPEILKLTKTEKFKRASDNYQKKTEILIKMHPGHSNINFRRSAIWRQTPEERKNADKLWDDIWNEHRQAAEAHRTTRKHLQDFIKPGMTMIEIW
jgi:hypothetical protein